MNKASAKQQASYRLAKHMDKVVGIVAADTSIVYDRARFLAFMEQKRAEYFRVVRERARNEQ